MFLKRFAALAFALVLGSALVCALSLGASAAEYESSSLKGDANGDGVVDGKDVTRIKKYFKQTTVRLSSGADANRDGRVDAADVEILLSQLVDHDDLGDGKMTALKIGYYVSSGAIYYYNNDGVMLKSTTVDGNRFGIDGRLVADESFVTVDGKTYYMVDNVAVFNYRVINNYIYYFGSDGVMRAGETADGNRFDANGHLVASDGFVRAGDDTYYLDGGRIVRNYKIINNYIYYFGSDGIMRTDATVAGNHFGEDGRLEADDSFATVDGKTYYLVDGALSYNYKVINNYLYYFGTDGVMRAGETADGNRFDADGRLVADDSFVRAGDKTYYLSDGKIVFNYLVINNYIYYFGSDGVMRTGETVEGNRFGSDGRLVGNNAFVTVAGKTYYLTDNTVALEYVVINNYIYYFGSDGVMHSNETVGGNRFDENGRLVAEDSFVTLDGDTYYISDGKVALDFVAIDNHIYYFGSDGVMRKSETVGGYTLGADGALVSQGSTSITIDGTKYIVEGNVARGVVNVGGRVSASDSDTNVSNNSALAGVTCTVVSDGATYTVTSDANGRFNFPNMYTGSMRFTFTKSGYITVSFERTVSREESLEIVLDRDVSNTLGGRVTIADRDLNVANNYPLAGARVTLERLTGTNSFRTETVTDANGAYSIGGLTAGVYRLTVEKDGYRTITQTVAMRETDLNMSNATLEAVSSASSAGGYAAGKVIDAKTARTVKDVSVVIRAGVNNITGTVVATLKTDSNGAYKTDMLEPGNYTVQIVDDRLLTDEDERYGSAAYTIKIVSGETVSGQDIIVSNRKGISANGLRIVLTWGSTPSDLDSHLNVSLNSGKAYNISYSHKIESGYASLDVDDQNGNGPETVTVENVADGVYKYYVYNYSGNPSITSSGARVDVYLDGSVIPAYTFYVPTVGSGVYWNVFKYNSATGEFISVNQVSTGLMQ